MGVETQGITGRTLSTSFVIIGDDEKEETEAPENTYWDVPSEPAPTDNSYWDLPDQQAETPAPSTANPYWEVPPSEGFEEEEEEVAIEEEEEGTEVEIITEEEETTPEETEEEYVSSDSADAPPPPSHNVPETPPDYNFEEDDGILNTLRLYNSLRQDLPEDFERKEGSNVDILQMPTGEEFAVCHLAAILPFTRGDKIPFELTHEDAATIALAVQDLNTGNGHIVPEVEGLPDRCQVRFTTEWADTEFAGGVALSHVVDWLGRTKGEIAPRPCAFLGAWRSAVSIPTSIVTGLFEYPQISAGSTSADLDDPSQYPLFGRTIPADSGNAIPIIRYIAETLEVLHLAVINVNDAYGNAYVEGMRQAAERYAPGMVLHQIPLDEGEGGIPAAVASLKATGYRYVFAIVFTSETHDAIMEEATAQGVAGTGLHNWLFGDSFVGTLDGRTFPANGVLANAYRGAGLLEVSGGVAGMTKFDNFQNQLSALHSSPPDMELIGQMFPKHPEDSYMAAEKLTGPDNTFLKEGVVSSTAPFMYEAVIGLGLAACEASNANPDGIDFTGTQHFEHFQKSSFTAFSGPIVLNEFASRDANSALYKVINYVEQLETVNGEQVVSFASVNTDLFRGGVWEATENQFIFNDGTTNLPPDLPPVEAVNNDNGTNLALIVVIPIAILVALGIGVYFYLENKRKKNDSVWVVAREDIKFADPPEIIGRGTFGLVLLGEYRGTQVAVKRVIPPKQNKKGSKDGANNPGNPGQQSMMASGVASFDPMGRAQSGFASGMVSRGTPHSSMSNSSNSAHQNSGLLSQTTGMLNTVAGGIGSGLDHFGSMIGVGEVNLAMGKKRSNESEATVWKRMKKEFMEEMRYLSKLRHPCITTVMGAVTTGEPMLILEYMDHGSLYDLLHNETMVIEGEIILPLLKDITQGLRFLHSADPQVIHGDLKSQNILVDNRFRAKVADFGLSQKQTLGGTGTPYWMAPELLRFESANTSASDIYSFGIILYEVFSRRDPYEGEDYEEVMKLVADKKVQKRPPAPRHMPEAVKILMKDCVDEDPGKRPHCDELDTRLKRIDADTVNKSQNVNGKSAQVSLFDIFPRHIAEALRDGRTVEAEHKECVTIFFSDIVGFTTISSELEPRKVADLLDRLYTKLDALSNKHDVFKVETIGDAYMAVTNLVKDQEEDHCARIAQFAVEAIAAANGTLIDREEEQKGYVNIRVGFHSGSVVADVVGTRNPRYCLFGDTVNTASRMESNSEINRIHCSRASAKLLQQQKPDLALKNRGKVKVKGKGVMNTYWVNEAGRQRGSSLFKDSPLIKETGSNKSMDSSDGEDKTRLRRKGKDEFEDDVKSDDGKKKKRRSSRKSLRFSSLLGKTPIDHIAESASLELSTSLDPMVESASLELSTTLQDRSGDHFEDDIEAPEVSRRRAPEVAPEPTPFGAAGEEAI